MKTVTATQLHADLYSLLDEVLKTGTPLHISHKDQIPTIKQLARPDKPENLIPRTDSIPGNPDDLADIQWEPEIDLDLP